MAKPKRKPKAKPKQPDAPGRVIDAAMKLAAEAGWRDLTLARIAEEANVPLAELYALFPSRQAILNAFSHRIDVTVLAAEEPGAREGVARDRLFDVLMRRFDALAPYRKAIGNILVDQGRDPLATCAGLCRLRRSMAGMLEAADLSASNLRGALRTKGLSAVYLATLRVWLDDESEDKARTMAALDRHLRRADRAAAACFLVR